MWTAVSNGGISYVRIAYVTYVMEKKKLGICARYEPSFDGINLQFQDAVWNAEESNYSVLNFLVTTNFMYAVCGSDSAIDIDANMNTKHPFWVPKSLHTVVFWPLIQCSLVGVNRRFEAF